MLIAVTPELIHIISLPSTGETPQHELLRFTRHQTTAEISRFGASRRLVLTDTDGQLIKLTGSAAVFSPYASGAKQVLALLAK